MTKGKFLLISIFGLILGLIFCSYLFFKLHFSMQTAQKAVQQILSPQQFSDAKTTQSNISEQKPFTQLTIPFLRARVYQSALGTLHQYQQHTAYTSYLTSYDSDGLQINALLTKPTGTMPDRGWPAIVFVHGYIAPSIYQTQQRYIEYVDYLARSGFVVLKIDLRGHGDSQGVATGAYYSADYIIDTLNARAALQSSGFVDATAVGLWGHSMAGNVVFRSLAVKPDISAAVIWAGAVYSYADLQKYGLQDNSYRPPASASARRRDRDSLFAEYGQFDPQSDFWKTVVATNYIQDMDTPLQMHHAVDDTVVDIGYSRDLMKLLDAASVTFPHELFEYPNGGHNITGSSFSQAMLRTVEFYQKYLKD